MLTTCLAAATGGAQGNSDTITTRRATVNADGTARGRNGLQVQSTRIQGALFADGAIPVGFTAADSQTHNLLVNTYYVSANSALIPGVPTLRRQTLVGGAGGPAIQDQEVAPGVENIQLAAGYRYRPGQHGRSLRQSGRPDPGSAGCSIHPGRASSSRPDCGWSSAAFRRKQGSRTT